MDDFRVGAAIRLVRQRRGWRQRDLEVRSGVSQSVISRMELGHLAERSLDDIRAVAAALDMRIDLVPRWRAGDWALRAARSGGEDVPRQAASLGGRARGLVRDLRRARCHRHPGLAPESARPPRHRAEDRPGRHQRGRRDVRPKAPARAADRPRARLGSGHRVGLADHHRHPDEPAAGRGARNDAGRGASGRRPSDGSLAAGPVWGHRRPVVLDGWIGFDAAFTADAPGSGGQQCGLRRLGSAA